MHGGFFVEPSLLAERIDEMRLAIGITLLVLAGLGLLGALGALAFAMLGFVGILADVSTAENQAFARDFLRYAGYTGLPGLRPAAASPAH